MSVDAVAAVGPDRPAVGEPGLWRRLRRRPAAMTALAVLLLLAVAAIAAPLLVKIWGHGPTDQYRKTGLSPKGIPVGPRAEFWLGTDQQGRDVLSRLVYGARASLTVGFAATVVAVVVGTAVGLLSGYLRGWVDAVLARLIEAVLSLPSLLLAVAFVAVAGGGTATTVGVLAAFSSAVVARLVRGLTLTAREADYVAVARSLGASRLRIMVVDILPNVLAPVVAYATLLFPTMIIGEATLSFLGLGVQAPEASWGSMLRDAQASRRFFVAPWMLVAPAVAILVTTLSATVLGDAVRDALDPRAARTRLVRRRRSTRADSEVAAS